MHSNAILTQSEVRCYTASENHGDCKAICTVRIHRRRKSGKAMNDLVCVTRLTKDGCTYSCKRLHDSLF